MSDKNYQELMKRTLVELRDMKAKLARAEEEKREPIAVVGMGCRFPSANDPSSFWRVLSEGVDAIRETPWSRWGAGRLYDEEIDTPGRIYVKQGAFLDDVEHFDAGFFGVTPREAQRMSPQQRVLLEVTWEALENSNIVPDQLFNTPGGVFIGACGFDYGPWNAGGLEEVDAYSLTGGSLSVIAGRVSYLLGLTGPSLVVDTACSSSLVAIHQACRSLRSGESNLALAGGVHVMSSPAVAVGLCRIRALSTDGRCKTFDVRANGYTRGEGCGVVVLKRLSDALDAGDDIVGLIRGTGVNQDGASGGLTVPSGPSQERVIRAALDEAGIEPHEVSFVEAHGTGTSLGDPIEIGALEAVYGTDRTGDPLRVGSVKTNIGHLEGAAGVAGLIKVLLSFVNEEIPPHLHLTEPNPHIPWSEIPIEIPTETTPWPRGDERRRAALSSFGLSGTNAHVVLEDAPPSSDEETTQGDAAAADTALLLTLSAKTESALNTTARKYSAFLRDHPESSLVDFCHTANHYRSTFEHRLAVPASSVGQLASDLASLEHGEPSPFIARGQTGEENFLRTAFVFTGQGSQYVGMARELYESQPEFQAAFDRAAEVLDRTLDQPLADVVYSESDTGATSPLHQTGYTQPALFAIEYALAALWRSWGVTPDWVMGHSVGEYVAAHLAGVFSLDDGLRLIAARGRLMQELPAGGGMAAVFADEDTTSSALAEVGDGAGIAAYNGDRNLVISGQAEAVKKACAALTAKGVQSQELRVSHAFHSALMDPMLDAFRSVAEEVTYSEPSTPMISNLSGELAGPEIATADYWVDHVRAPVRFVQGTRALLRANEAKADASDRLAIVEVGPKPTLLGMVAAVGADPAPILIPSLKPGVSDSQQALSGLGQLWTLGGKVDRDAIDTRFSPSRIALPNYGFDRQRFPLETGFSPESDQRAHQAEPGSVVDLLERDGLEELTQRLAAVSDLTAEQTRLLPELLGRVAEAHRQDRDKASLQDWTYELEWRSQPKSDSGETLEADGLWVLFGGSEALRRSLSSRLQEQGVSTASVTTGDSFAHDGDDWVIESEAPADYVRLLAELGEGEKRIDRIVHLSSLIRRTSVTEETSVGRLIETQRESAHTLLYLARAIADAALDSATRLWVVSRSAVPAGGAESLAIDAAPIWGMGRTLALEIPEHWGGLIDFGPTNPDRDELGVSAKELDQLLAELANPTLEDQVAFRQETRYVPRLIPATSDALAPLPISEEGAYLVTGGLGGLGLSLARWLVERGAQHLVLTGRSGASSDAAKEAVRELEGRGVRIDVAQADVADETSMNDLFGRLDAENTLLRGVIHCAGVGRYEELSEIDSNCFDAVLRPKTLGSWLLHERTRDRELDFFVCCSSIASLWGSRTQVHYAAANHFEDVLAHHRRSRGLPALTVNWGPLGGSGMLTEDFLELMVKLGVSPLPIDRVLAALERMLGSDRAQLTVADVDWSKFRGVLEARRARPFFEELGTGSDTGDQPVDTGPSLPDVLEETEPRERLDRLVEEIQIEVARVMGISVNELPPPDRGFFDIGMDSIMAVDLKNRFSQRVGAELSSTLAFDYPTIDALAEHLIRDVLQLPTDRADDDATTSSSSAEEAFSEEELDELSGSEVSAMLDAELEELDGLIGNDVDERPN